jgi:hypothetical protein
MIFIANPNPRPSRRLPQRASSIKTTFVPDGCCPWLGNSGTAKAKQFCQFRGAAIFAGTSKLVKVFGFRRCLFQKKNFEKSCSKNFEKFEKNYSNVRGGGNCEAISDGAGVSL